jgi:uncharacterized protein YutD
VGEWRTVAVKFKGFLELVKDELEFHKRHPELLIALVIAGSAYFILKEVNR